MTVIAEHALMLMLCVSRRLTWQHEMVKSGRWRGNNVEDVKLFELKNTRPTDIQKDLENIMKSVSLDAKTSAARFVPKLLTVRAGPCALGIVPGPGRGTP